MKPQKSLDFVILAVLDGWGIGPESKGNAIRLADTPNMDKYGSSYPHTQLAASGKSVGLPRGEAGNTETGHINLGAGRIVYQDLERVNMSIADGSFFENDTLLGAINHAKKNASAMHFMGLIGAGGVHSNMEHLYALIRLAKNKNVKKLYIHAFTDGRDSPPTSAKTYIDSLKRVIEKEGVGEIASIMGRYWAMDRDQRWERTQKAYNALTKGEGKMFSSATDAIETSYADDATDEFIEPSLVTDKSGKPKAIVKDNDAVVFFNFRIDRPRQLTAAFVLDDMGKAPDYLATDKHEERFHHHRPEKSTDVFERENKIDNLFFATMTEYNRPLVNEGAQPAFPPEIVQMPIGRVIASKGMRQLRITESEKERFVTYYFNGLREEPFEMEERIIIPSPKVATYDKKPEMSAERVTQTLIDSINAMQYRFIVVNFPNADMVGHTGNLKAAIQAIEFVDSCIGKLASYVLPRNAALLITADHGNAEQMINPETGEIDTEHSTHPVPFIAISQIFTGRTQNLQSGILADIAPTILGLLNIDIPGTMTGRNLLQ